MIKFTMNKGDRKLLGLGLSDQNLALLQMGRPIMIMAEEVDSSVDLLIFWGTDEEAMQQQLTEQGLITSDTVVKVGFTEQ